MQRKRRSSGCGRERRRQKASRTSSSSGCLRRYGSRRRRREKKRELLEKLSAWKKKQAEREVETLVGNMPPQRSRRQYKQYLEQIKSYEDADLTSYEEILSEKRTEAEKQEIAEYGAVYRKTDRAELFELLDRLRAEEFLPELLLPYQEKINKVDQTDGRRGNCADLSKSDADELCGGHGGI